MYHVPLSSSLNSNPDTIFFSNHENFGENPRTQLAAREPSLGAMSAMKDPTIKLFGKTIPCPQTTVSAHHHHHGDEDCCKEEMEVECSLADDLKDQNDTTTHQDPVEDKNNNMNKDSDSSTFETPNGTSMISEGKILLKADKILPCPRCNSLDTKFCYFNNYNTRQPRHFCKNCQRYWTAGGSMRNVPIGSGRRKNKHNSTSYYRDLITSEALQSTAASSLLQKLGNHASSLQDQRIIAAGKSSHQGYPVPVPCFPGPRWQIPWNSTIPLPQFGPAGHSPVSFYPQPTFWSPWNDQQPLLMSPTSTTTNNSSLVRSYLGKHSWDGDRDRLNLLPISSKEESLKQKCILIPKTLLIGDPNEAANSSIRATLRTQNEKTNSISEEGVFHNFQSKSNKPLRISHKSPVMQANPAALSRSRIFHEGP